MQPMKRSIKVSLCVMAGSLIFLSVDRTEGAINEPPGCQAVSITTNPVSQTKCLGSSASFSVVATGSGPLIYRWQRNHSNLSDGGSVSGSTTPNLRLSGLVAGDSSYGYRVMVSNVCQGVSSHKISTDATLTVSTTSSLTASITGPDETCYGSTNTYTSGSGSGNSWSISGQGAIVGAANGQTLSVASSASGSYRLALTVISGSCTDSTTETATIIPAWATISGDSDVCAGSKNIYAGPTAPDLDYSWSISGQGTIIGATSDLSIFVLAGNSGSYTLSLSVSQDGHCSSIASNVVSIFDPVVIVTQPVSQVACAGGTATFSVAATGSSLTYQWQKTGVNLVDDSNISGANSATLTISHVTTNFPPGPAWLEIDPSNETSGVSYGTVIEGQTYQYFAEGCAVVSYYPVHDVTYKTSDPDGNQYLGYYDPDYGGSYICDTFWQRSIASSGFPCPGLVAYSLVGKVGGHCIQLGSRGSFVAPASGTLLLYFNGTGWYEEFGSWEAIISPDTMADNYDVVVTGSCGSETSIPAQLSLGSPTAAISGNATICSGQSTQIRAALTGTGPWKITWSDGVTQSNIMASPVTRLVSPTSNTPYSITNFADAYCTNSVSGSATVTVTSGGTVATPKFSPEGRAFLSSVTVTVSCATAWASIHYTTNGLMPTMNDPSITSGGVLALSQTKILRSRAFTNGYCASDIKGGLYQVGPHAVTGGNSGFQEPEVSFFVQTNGTVWAWGSNTSGQLGVDTSTGEDEDEHSPMFPMLVLSNVSALAAGSSHGLALDTTGSVWYLSEGFPYAPTLVAGLSNAVAAGAQEGFSEFNYSLVLESDGTVWAWGNADFGQLGLGYSGGYGSGVSTPTQALTPSGITAIAAGEVTSMALRSDGTVWVWGDYLGYFFGSGDSTGTPMQVSGLTNIVAIAEGREHGVALAQDGTVWTWGWDDQGQLGTGDSYVNSSNGWDPAQVPGLSNVVGIAAGDFHTVAVTAAGQVYTWGANLGYYYVWGVYNAGQLGTGSTSNYVSTPQLVPGLSGVKSVSASGNHTLAVASCGGVNVVWAWGDNSTGELGDGTTNNRATPVAVHFPFDSDSDGIPDWQECQLGLDPLNADQNHDGLLDGIDLAIGFNPGSGDVDADNNSNAFEITTGHNPFDPGSFPIGITNTVPVITLIEPANAVLIH